MRRFKRTGVELRTANDPAVALWISIGCQYPSRQRGVRTYTQLGHDTLRCNSLTMQPASQLEVEVWETMPFGIIYVLDPAH